MRMFISYSRDDARWAKRFEKRLKPLTGDGGVHLWRDDRIPVGADWRAEIDRGLAEADAGLLLVSPNFLASDFILRKELPYLIERHRRGTLRLFCVLLKDCLFEATPLAALQCAHPHDAPLADLDDDACQTAMMAIARKIRAASQDRTSAGALPVDVKALPSSIDPLVGRDSELDDLDAVLADDVIRIATLEAWGGVGKSALVEGWLNRLVGEDYRGLSRVYGYSFYRQGLEGGASSDEFFEKAFDFFGEPKPRPIPADARGRRLAQRVLDARTLLILDGLEPLQAPEGGKLLDPAMRALLVALANARPGPGLCLITTRLQVPMLQKRVGATVQRFKLGRLTESDGVALLRKRGADGHEKDLRWAVGEAKGHALTLKLVGTFVKRRLKGDIRRAAEVDLLRPDPDGVPRAARVLDAYARVLRDRLAGDVVRLLGLFDQPASADCVDALRDAPVIPGLTDQLVDALDGDWQEALTELRELGLLLDDADGALDAHPLVRAHAAARLEREVPEAWRMGHLRLYEHLTETAAHRPDTKEGLLPLYQAVVHGCRAGRVQEACDAVYYERIRRGGEAYSVKKLGLFGLDLTALAAFFEAPFTRPHGSLTAADQAWLLSQAGYTLRALGRLEESEAPMRAGLAMGEAQEAWKAAATRAGNLSELNV
ncbi:MAG: TIR domain-containing protein, partial [Acidobacteriota bacterium]